MIRDLFDEFVAHLGVDAEDVDPTQVRRLSMEAQALIRAVKPNLGEVVEDWPDNAFIVLLRVMSRGMNTRALPHGVDRVSENAGDFSYSLSFSESAQGGGLWLTRQDRLILGARAGGAYSVDLGAGVPRQRRGGDYQW